eukprot:2078342-Prymnesium_polylepis.2
MKSSCTRLLCGNNLCCCPRGGCRLVGASAAALVRLDRLALALVANGYVSVDLVQHLQQPRLLRVRVLVAVRRAAPLLDVQVQRNVATARQL